MTIEQCWLTNQTGAIIRFRPSQAPSLPRSDVNLHVELFDRRVIAGRFHLHPANPYVAGPEVRHFIKSRVSDRSREQALIDVSGRYWRLFEAEPVAAEVRRHGVSGARASSGEATGQDLDRILTRLDAIAETKSRHSAYQRLLRPAGLRQILIQLMGAKCQVEGCNAVEESVGKWGEQAAGLAIIEVHHIEAVAKREDHSAKNLCVLCGNHHGLIHGFGPWTVRHQGDNVILTRDERSLTIVRELSFLREGN